ncbi:hypothetical protein ACFV5N_00980 [Streptomyces sp. NPDC059853]|uniref:hypothetical protein n=1 Tax=Streptomyces sp. NPDC059853 TaxID=3346973 RepID=UPI003663DE45
MLAVEAPPCAMCPAPGVVEVIVIVVGEERIVRSCGWHVLAAGIEEVQAAIDSAAEQRAGAAR